MALRALMIPRRLVALRSSRTPVSRVVAPANRLCLQKHWYSSETEGEKVYDPKIIAIVDDVSKLSLIEVADLVELLKSTLNIQDVQMSVGVAAAPVAGAEADSAAVEEKTEFDVKLTGHADKAKIKVIKEVRNILPDLKLAEAKKMVEDLPQVLKTGITKEDAEKLKEVLEAVGGTVELV